jgi:hypothetical protein
LSVLGLDHGDEAQRALAARADRVDLEARSRMREIGVDGNDPAKTRRAWTSRQGRPPARKSVRGAAIIPLASTTPAPEVAPETAEVRRVVATRRNAPTSCPRRTGAVEVPAGRRRAELWPEHPRLDTGCVHVGLLFRDNERTNVHSEANHAEDVPGRGDDHHCNGAAIALRFRVQERGNQL